MHLLWEVWTSDTGAFSVKMYAKMKELGPIGGGMCLASPLDPPMQYTDTKYFVLFLHKILTKCCLSVYNFLLNSYANLQQNSNVTKTTYSNIEEHSALSRICNELWQWWILDFPLRDANLRCGRFLAKTYVKMKKLDPVGSACAVDGPCTCQWQQFKI